MFIHRTIITLQSLQSGHNAAIRILAFGRLKIERLLGYLLNGRTHTHTRGEGIPFEEPRMTFFTFCTILMQRWYLVL